MMKATENGRRDDRSDELRRTGRRLLLADPLMRPRLVVKSDVVLSQYSGTANFRMFRGFLACL